MALSQGLGLRVWGGAQAGSRAQGVGRGLGLSVRGAWRQLPMDHPVATSGAAGYLEAR